MGVGERVETATCHPSRQFVSLCLLSVSNKLFTNGWCTGLTPSIMLCVMGNSLLSGRETNGASGSITNGLTSLEIRNAKVM